MSMNPVREHDASIYFSDVVSADKIAADKESEDRECQSNENAILDRLR